MKKVFIYISIIVFLFMAYSCEPNNMRTRCSYEYPINIKNLKDTIKTTDTLWVENDLDPRFCLYEGIYKNGIMRESPTSLKLVGDTFIFYSLTVIGYDKISYGLDSFKYYDIYLREQDGRYKSKYGIVFPEQGTYALYDFGGNLENGIDKRVHLNAYFNTPSNNIYLLPEKIQEEYNYSLDKPYYYKTYYIAVVK